MKVASRRRLAILKLKWIGNDGGKQNVPVAPRTSVLLQISLIFAYCIAFRLTTLKRVTCMSLEDVRNPKRVSGIRNAIRAEK